jgi:hypothetical protein
MQTPGHWVPGHHFLDLVNKLMDAMKVLEHLCWGNLSGLLPCSHCDKDHSTADMAHKMWRLNLTIFAISKAKA